MYLNIKGVNYENKSFDVTKANIETKTKIIDKFLSLNTIIIHKAPTSLIGARGNVELLNYI